MLMNYLIHGLESYLINQNIDEIIKKNNILENSVYKLNMQEESISSLVEKLDTYDLFSNNKLVVAYNCDFLTSSKDINNNTNLLINYLNNYNKDSILILSVDKKIDERKKIVKEVKKLCNVIKCDNLSDVELFNYIKNSFNNKNYTIDNSSINEFIFRTGNDLFTINNEINKLLMYKNNEKVICIDDIKNSISKKIYDDVFLFVESVIANDKNKMFLMYDDLVNYHNEEIIKLISLIYSQFRLMYQVSVLKKDKFSIDEISKKIGIHPFRVKLIYNKYIDTSKVLRCLIKLFELDLKIKTGEINKEIGFELFLLSN